MYLPLMKVVIKISWRSLLCYGTLCALCGLLLPVVNNTADVLGVFSLLSGFVLLTGAIYSGKEEGNRWFILQTGTLQLVLAVVAFASPGSEGLKLVLLAGTCAIVTAISAFIASARLRQEYINDSPLIISGVASLLFGCWMVFFPGEGLADRKWHIGIYLLFTGLTHLLLIYKVWKLEKEIIIHLYEFESQSV